MFCELNPHKSQKQDAAHESECSQVLMVQMSKHMDMQSRRTLSAIVYLNSLVHVSHVTIPVHRRLWNMEEDGVLSVECGVCKV